MTYEDFFVRVAIDDADIIKAKHYLDVRGISEHIFVADYIQSLKANKVTYAEVATAFRYDKRIRRIIYKYIGFLEEYIRAYIINKYEDNYSNIIFTNTVLKKINKTTSFYEAIVGLTFGELISQVLFLSSDDINNLFHCDYSQQNLRALVGLRNEVNHNRFLLHNKSLRECQVGTMKQCSLYANILNLINHLPAGFDESFIGEINEAVKSSNSQIGYQMEWVLVPDIVIQVIKQ